ncbi:MAG: hypothetical protein Q8N77_03595, partial [Nanoarchaeota archaeon]|nr:hypothetical protein [Nanoarchaeota archaeon]
MSELNLEQQVERIKLAMDTCLDIYQTNDKTTFINKLKILKELDIIKELNTWLAKCDSQKRNYPRIKETVAYEVFSTLFKPKKKEETGFLWTNVQLGLSIMDIYNQK